MVATRCEATMVNPCHYPFETTERSSLSRNPSRKMVKAHPAICNSKDKDHINKTVHVKKAQSS